MSVAKDVTIRINYDRLVVFTLLRGRPPSRSLLFVASSRRPFDGAARTASLMREKSQIVSEVTLVVLENGSFSGLKKTREEKVRHWVVKDSSNLSPLARELLNIFLLLRARQFVTVLRR